MYRHDLLIEKTEREIRGCPKVRPRVSRVPDEGSLHTAKHKSQEVLDCLVAELSAEGFEHLTAPN